MFTVVPTQLPGVLILEPRVFADDRGFFLETWNASAFEEIGLPLHFVQDNQSCSIRGVLRGLHFQKTRPQGKLVRVVSGEVFDVAVDVRGSEATFGKWVGVHLSAQNKRMLWIPPGFAHGFLSLENDTNVIYKCTELYAPGDEHTLIWNDPEVGVKWPQLPSEPLLSPKDRLGLGLDRATSL